MDPASSETRTFEPPFYGVREGWYIILCGGLGLIIAVAFLPMGLGFPPAFIFGLLPVGLMLFGLFRVRCPQRIVVSPDSIVVEFNNRTENWTWAQLGWAEFRPSDMSTKKSLLIYDLTGRKVITLSPDFKDYDDLTREVLSRLQGKEVPSRRLVRLRRARADAIVYGLLAICGLPSLVLTVSNISLNSYPFQFFSGVLYILIAAFSIIRTCVLSASCWDYMVDETTGKPVWRKID